MSLKSFIRSVRATKTLAEERAVIQKESAAVRTSFREESHNSYVRRNNVAKLLYLFTIGERTHFGQLECLKLLASPKFADKRLGYLGTMLLLDENQEVLTLVTNSLQNDLNHSNQYVVGLALCTLGNIASQEMARDLFQQIDQLLTTSNPYIRRKAALCAMRIVRKAPELLEIFVDKAKLLLNDHNHGVLLAGISLIAEMCTIEPNVVGHFVPVAPALIGQLKQLSVSGFSPEHDVSNIADPFLQVQILRLLGILCQDDLQLSEQLSDILTQVASHTDSSKNVGNAILYETVRTILDIDANSGLRILGVNILGKFLANKDNNIRYVALNTLLKVVAVESNAVQRHRNTILDCLRDPDVSIRHRAMDLSFTLVNESNVRILIRELLAFLEVAEKEFVEALTTNICAAASQYSPDNRWHVDTVIRVLKLAGNQVKDDIVSSFIRLIASNTDIQLYAAQKLYSAIKSDVSQGALVLAAAWTIGEFGDILLHGGSFHENEKTINVLEEEIIDVLDDFLNSTFATPTARGYVVNCLIKLSNHISKSNQMERVRRIIDKYKDDLDVEIQQRAIEYSNIFMRDELRKQVFERMPPSTAPEKTLTSVDSSRKRHDLVSFNGQEAAEPTNNTDMLSELFAGASVQPTPFTKLSSPAVVAYDGDGFQLAFKQQQQNDRGKLSLVAQFTNTASENLRHFTMHVAVAKSQTLSLESPSSTTLATGSKATQVLHITGPLGARPRLKLKLSLTRGQTVEREVIFDGQWQL